MLGALVRTAVALGHHPEDSTVIVQRAEALMLAGQLAEALPLWSKVGNDAKPKVAAARILCEVVLGVEVTTPSAHLAKATSQEFIRWYWRLVDFAAEVTILQLHANVSALEPALPEAAQSVQTVIAKLAPVETLS